MKHQTMLIRTALLGAAMVCSAIAQAQVQVPASGDENVAPELARHQAMELSKGDPARWFQEDVTPEQKLRTSSKESAAALRENLADCKKLGSRDRRDCEQQAHQTYREEMARARQRAMASR
ncbi:hypothetical protein [Massilia sp. CF038]|uniref:hypothetical protein n=1 Tax=Massilia sp. CF038 TaxID=1881045 RepID=UPI00091210C6|nr:hypothetical protein [Massilia sp. CF038]SHH07497.1 hypothetical protein SAMN05428948_2644 [Massilia sp. CF038]